MNLEKRDVWSPTPWFHGCISGCISICIYLLMCTEQALSTLCKRGEEPWGQGRRLPNLSPIRVGARIPAGRQKVLEEVHSPTLLTPVCRRRPRGVPVHRPFFLLVRWQRRQQVSNALKSPRPCPKQSREENPPRFHHSPRRQTQRS